MNIRIYRFILNYDSNISIHKNDELLFIYKRQTVFFRIINSYLYDINNNLLLQTKMRAFHFNNLKVIKNNLGYNFQIKNNLFLMKFTINENEKYNFILNKIFKDSILIAKIINNRNKFSLKYDFDIEFYTDDLEIHKKAIICFLISKTNLNLY